MRTPLLWFLALGLGGLLLVGGCASSEEAGTEGDADSTETQRRDAPTPARTRGPDLAPQRDEIRTVQLYRGTDERSLPVISLDSGESLTLEFDLMKQEGRPVTVHFYHADRHWNRDLSPNQYLESYHDDTLLQYRPSQGTVVPYVHYTYRFPNDDIRFRLSGNYVLRVSERGREDAVLFERAFFVTGEDGGLNLGGEAIMVPGQRQRSVRPVARFNPPADLRGDPFGYTACFVRNGRLPDTRCEGDPLLIQQPKLTFKLDRARAFDPTTADYTVDLSNLRSGRKIERTNRTATPFRVLLEPDYARFSGRTLDASLNGQILIREALPGYANPARTAEYVRTTFAFVPPKERPLAGGVVVAGSFSGMDADRGTEMVWRPGRARYEGEVLLKQGYYQYFYEASDPLFRKTVRESQSRLQSTYTTFVYYEDTSISTDRLLRVSSFRE